MKGRLACDVSPDKRKYLHLNYCAIITDVLKKDLYFNTICTKFYKNKVTFL